MVFQHKKFFAKEGPVPKGDLTIPLGQAAIKRAGKDITLLSYGSGFYLCQEALGELDKLDIDAEVIDLRTLKPLDMALVAESIKKTHRAVIVHEACLTGGFGAELTARIQDEVFDYLDAPIKRVAAKDFPIPFSPPLEDYVLPNVADVIEAARVVTYR
jgi:pyruvate dehydrogenase E1 component beta subunit